MQKSSMPSAAQMTEQVHLLLAAFAQRNYPDQESANLAIKVYLIAIDGYEYQDIKQAVIDFIRFQVPDQDKVWPPEAPALAERCAIVADRRYKAVRRLKPPMLQTSAERTPPTPEERARVKTMVAKFVSTHGFGGANIK